MPTHSRTIGLAQPYKCISKCYFLYGNVPRGCVLSYFNCVRQFVTLWTVAHQAPLSIRFSKQEYWSGFPCPPPGDLPHLLCALHWQAGSLPLVPPGKPAIKDE